MRSIEEVLSHLINLTQKEVLVAFTRGQLCAYLIEMGMKASEIASEINCSAALVREQVKTYRAFPTEEDRDPYAELKFYHFRLAAGTSDPHYWMTQAADNAWSTREMSKAIKGAPIKDELKEADRVFGLVERILMEGGQAAMYLHERISTLITGGASIASGLHGLDLPETSEEEEGEQEIPFT